MTVKQTEFTWDGFSKGSHGLPSLEGVVSDTITNEGGFETKPLTEFKLNTETGPIPCYLEANSATIDNGQRLRVYCYGAGEKSPETLCPKAIEWLTETGEVKNRRTYGGDIEFD